MLLQFNQKGRPSKKQKICELSKLSKKKNKKDEDEGGPVVEVPLPVVETELTIPGEDFIWQDAAKAREAMKLADSEQVLLAVAWVSDAERHLFQLFPEVTFWDTAQKTNRENLCFLPVARTETTVVSRTCVHLCPVNPCGFSLGYTARQCQLY